MVKALTIALLVCIPAIVGAQGVSFQGLKKLNGTQLYLRVIGKGEPILVIHGGPGMNQSYFFPHLNTLAKRNQLIFFDQRASGLSATPRPDSVTFTFFIKDIESIRKEFKIDRLNILAHSWGAILAIEYALAYPDHVKKMILCSPVAFSSEYTPELSQIQMKRMTRQDSVDRATILASADFKAGRAAAYQQLLLLSFRHSFYKDANFSKLSYQVPTNYVQASRVLFTGLGPDLTQYNYYERLKEINHPTLLIHGSADAITLAVQQRAKENLINGQLVIFKYSGHFPFIEEPEHFRKEVVAFLLKK